MAKPAKKLPHQTTDVPANKVGDVVQAYITLRKAKGVTATVDAVAGTWTVSAQ